MNAYILRFRYLADEQNPPTLGDIFVELDCRAPGTSEALKTGLAFKPGLEAVCENPATGLGLHVEVVAP